MKFTHQSGHRARLRSPLRYPGGKTFLAKTIANHVRCCMHDDESGIYSPFIGGGSVELELAARGFRVWAADKDWRLVQFWKAALTCPSMVAHQAEAEFPLTPERFYTLQKWMRTTEEPADVAATYFILNRASFNGSVLSGGCPKKIIRFTKSSIERMRTFRAPNLVQVEHLDFEDSLAAASEAAYYLYCDPPYIINNDSLYGDAGDLHKGFNHAELFNILSNHKSGFLLSYNDCPSVRWRYKDFEIIELPTHYGSRSKKPRHTHELLIRG